MRFLSIFSIIFVLAGCSEADPSAEDNLRPSGPPSENVILGLIQNEANRVSLSHDGTQYEGSRITITAMGDVTCDHTLLDLNTGPNTYECEVTFQSSIQNAGASQPIIGSRTREITFVKKYDNWAILSGFNSEG